MDARVKGIRRLTVVYYNFVDPKVVYELYEAAHIMAFRFGWVLNLKLVSTIVMLNSFGRRRDLRTQSRFWTF